MSETPITESWKLNYPEWIKAIDEKTIGSREITSPAIYDTICQYKPESVLDLGCGEGWLTRKLMEAGIKSVGIDATEGLIDRAKEKGGAFYVKTYETIIEEQSVPQAPYEAVVLNFCLYHREETGQLLGTLKHLLHKRRLVMIQTLHPFAFAGTGFAYEDQWIADSWKGLKGNFHSPHTWYYRTLEGWMAMFERSGLRVVTVKEPKAPQATVPSSIIFVLSVL